ncbi:hypothetical protein PF004_g13902 [Phytophthora fragariae]|nr:hypothetical protein PF004_g13902 [Phytophthora fragariae]
MNTLGPCMPHSKRGLAGQQADAKFGNLIYMKPTECSDNAIRFWTGLDVWGPQRLGTISLTSQKHRARCIIRLQRLSCYRFCNETTALVCA